MNNNSDSLESIDCMVSLPAASSGQFCELDPQMAKDLFAASDPEGRQLGSGAGAAWLLASAWRKHGAGSFSNWLAESKKLIIQGGGESRRLPAYAPEGKLLAPIPTLPGSGGQRPCQCILDLQIPSYEAIMRHTGSGCRVLIACGDVLLIHRQYVPRCPEADIVIVGVPSNPEEASRHGVIITQRDNPDRITSFLHKPTVDCIRNLGKDEEYRLDSGIWLLSEKAVMFLMKKSGWNPEKQAFEEHLPAHFDLYGQMGPSLGAKMAEGLTCATMPLDNAGFLHLGTTSELVSSVSSLLHENLKPGDRSPAIVFNSHVECPFSASIQDVWIENSMLGRRWTLSGKHVLTGIPENDWEIQLPAGACLDIAPITDTQVCIRAYGFGDDFRGDISSRETLWFGRPISDWLANRGIASADAGLRPGMDIFDAPIFPVVETGTDAGRFIKWMIAPDRQDDKASRNAWLNTKRFSARDLLHRTNAVLRRKRRIAHVRSAISGMSASEWRNACCKLDLDAAARMTVDGILSAPRPPAPGEISGNSLGGVHDSMYRSAIAALESQPGSAAEYEAQAFTLLREQLTDRMRLNPAVPVRNLLDDQIVWGRSPARLDLAGGWTDTPPYCIEYGGNVVNAAVDLNGQPPIQVFGRICEQPAIHLHSVDLGISHVISSYEELRQFGPLGCGFGIAQTALMLAGFDPDFSDGKEYDSLESQLKSIFGGGLELTMLVAIPKGSGLGTSSILAATTLGTLNEMCKLGWPTSEIFTRTMALEQILTSGGGWQDQIGGLVGGLKFIRSKPGLIQQPDIMSLDSRFFGPERANRTVLLYYTGLTRVAHDILGDIVGGLFLNSSRHLRIIREIGFNAEYAVDAISRGDWHAMCEVIRRSWRLNQELDGCTNPPQIRKIVSAVGDYIEACKLLGAGGGGYMLFLAKNEEAAERLRKTLNGNPPNVKARFVDLSLSTTGLRVTMS